MLDATLWDSENMNVGLRYEGQRKPSQILEAIYPDLEMVCVLAMEGGEDWLHLQHITLGARAMMALTKSEPDLDMTFGNDEDEMDGDPDFTALVQHIHNLIEFIDQAAPPCTTYGWFSDDPDDDGFEALGLWPDWDAVSKGIADEIILDLDDYETLTEYQEDIRKDGYKLAVLTEGEETMLLDTSTCEVIWRW